MNKLLMTLTGMLLILACSRESNLVDPSNARQKSFLQDSIPGDSVIDSTDTVPHYPTDSIFHQKIKGLIITPSSLSDSIIELHIETSENYPVAHSTILAGFYGFTRDSLQVGIHGVQALFPYTPGSAPAKVDIWGRFNPGVNVPFTVDLNYIQYAGSISISGPNYTISWAHDSIILISPKTFPR